MLCRVIITPPRQKRISRAAVGTSPVTSCIMASFRLPHAAVCCVENRPTWVDFRINFERVTPKIIPHRRSFTVAISIAPSGQGDKTNLARREFGISANYPNIHDFILFPNREASKSKHTLSTRFTVLEFNQSYFNGTSISHQPPKESLVS